MIYLRYLWYILRHKWWVLYYSRSTGASLRLALVHDLSKFGPAEFGPYARWFYRATLMRCETPSEVAEYDRLHEDFRRAWQHHKSRNKHHPEYWQGSVQSEPIQMPHEYIDEMIADWLGAGRAITGRNNLQEWWNQNKTRFSFHPLTLVHVEHKLWRIGVQVR